MIGIYKITNLDNGKMYIGQSVDIHKRWYEHIYELNRNTHSNNRLQKSWNCHGEDRFEFSIIEECSIEELNDREKYWVDKLRTYVGFKDSNGYNETIGGDGNRILSGEIVKPVCDMYNSGLTVPQIAKKLNWNQKKVRRHLRFGTILKICDYNTDDKHLLYKKKVVCLNNGKVFNSVKDAEEYYSIHGVASCCVNHKYAGKDSEGHFLIWMHLDEYKKMTQEEIDKYIQDIEDKAYAKYVVRLNDRKIYENSQFAAKASGLRTGATIQNVCNGKQNHSGKDDISGLNYAWVYYKNYKDMSEERIQELIDKAQIPPIQPKKVVCLNNGMIFDDSVEAAKWALKTNSTIIKSNCLCIANSAGRHPETNELLAWMYIDDFDQASDEERREKLELAEYKGGNPQTTKKVVCLNNKYLFRNRADAAKWCGMNKVNNLTRCLNGEEYLSGKHPETNEKLRWMYYEDYIKLYDESDLIKYHVA